MMEPLTTFRPVGHPEVAACARELDAQVEVADALVCFSLAGLSFRAVLEPGGWRMLAPVGGDAATLARVRAHFEARLDPLLAHARSCGAVPRGFLRAVVLEPDGRLHHHDHEEALARQYALDVAWEPEDERGRPLVALFDAALARVVFPSGIR